jgi:hypothetical protein
MPAYFGNRRGLRSGSAVAEEAGTFLPSDLASLTAWFDGDEFTGTPDATAIATWTDQEGTNDATQGVGANQPTVDATGLNSMAVVDFDGGHVLNLPDFVSAYTAGSGFFVCKNDVDPGVALQDGPPLADFGTDAAQGDHYPFPTDSAVYHDFGSTARKSAGDPATSLATWHIGNFNSASAHWSYYLNATSQFTTGTNTVGFGSVPTIGRCAASTGFFPGKIAEILIFNAVLSSTDREKVEGYLAHRWGLTAVLPAPHPYKSVAP